MNLICIKFRCPQTKQQRRAVRYEMISVGTSSPYFMFINDVVVTSS